MVNWNLLSAAFLFPHLTSSKEVAVTIDEGDIMQSNFGIFSGHPENKDSYYDLQRIDQALKNADTEKFDLTENCYSFAMFRFIAALEELGVKPALTKHYISDSIINISLDKSFKSFAPGAIAILFGSDEEKKEASESMKKVDTAMNKLMNLFHMFDDAPGVAMSLYRSGTFPPLVDATRQVNEAFSRLARIDLKCILGDKKVEFINSTSDKDLANMQYCFNICNAINNLAVHSYHATCGDSNRQTPEVFGSRPNRLRGKLVDALNGFIDASVCHTFCPTVSGGENFENLMKGLHAETDTCPARLEDLWGMQAGEEQCTPVEEVKTGKSHTDIVVGT